MSAPSWAVRYELGSYAATAYCAVGHRQDQPFGREFTSECPRCSVYEASPDPEVRALREIVARAADVAEAEGLADAAEVLWAFDRAVALGRKV